jgi:hypothetical protein
MKHAFQMQHNFPIRDNKKKIKLRMLSRASMFNNSKTFQNTSPATLPLEEQTKAMAALNKAQKVCCILNMLCSLKRL